MKRSTHYSVNDSKSESELSIIGVGKYLKDPKEPHDNTADKTETKVYKRRWYVLFVYSLVTFTQAALWNTWGPIASSSEKAFGWQDSDIALLANWGPISFIPCALLFSWIVDVKGLRLACIIAAFVSAVGTAVRCITSEPPYVKWTINVGQFINDIGGPVAMGSAPVISSIWFPPNQRTTATGICAVANYFGVAAPFLIGPYMVPERNGINSYLNGNGTYSNSSYSIVQNRSSSTTKETEIQEIRKNIMVMNYVECGWAVFVLLLVLVYFPSRPEISPSVTATRQRLDFKAGLKGLIRNKMFWMVSATYAISLGVLGYWQSIMNVVLKPHGITERQAGWIGFYSIVAGNIAAVVVSIFADIFAKHMKTILIVLYVGASACFLWYNLILTDAFETSTAQIYASIILGTLFVNAAPPLFFEMVCESTYPIAEGITNFTLTLMFNFVGLIFLFVMMIPDIGLEWQNWSLLGSAILTIPIFLMMDNSYNRLSIDERSTQPEKSET